MRTHGMRNSDRILHGDQTLSENNFYRPTMPPTPTEDFCDTHADARPVGSS